MAIAFSLFGAGAAPSQHRFCPGLARRALGDPSTPLEITQSHFRKEDVFEFSRHDPARYGASPRGAGFACILLLRDRLDPSLFRPVTPCPVAIAGGNLFSAPTAAEAE